jgi:3-oxoacyl-[acyl-carrier protein] reductase
MSTPLAVVSGASRGIGHVIARHLSATHRVVVLGRTAHALEAVAAECGARAIPVDITDPDAVDRAWAEIAEHEGDADLLVNNAGLSEPSGPLWETDPDSWWRVQEVNVRGTFLLCRKALPAMVARGSGRIVNVASNAAFNPSWDAPGLVDCASYAASKAAVVRLTEVLAGQTAAYGVRVFAISPGMVRTEMTAALDAFSTLPDDVWSPPELAAELVDHLARGELDALSGRYIHAALTDWQGLAAEAEQIVADDRLTLRVKLD